MTYLAGIDIGAASSKAVIIEDRKVVSSHLIPSGGDYCFSAGKVMKEALIKKNLSIKDVKKIVATGGGAGSVPFPSTVISDITCHGRAVSFLRPSVRTVVDIGDLFSRAFRLGPDGKVSFFVLSGKCAGGSGKILQVIARVLNVELSEIGKLSLKSENRVDFNSGCAVFMETEAVSRIAEGAAREDLLNGVHHALSSQIFSLAERVGLEKDYALVGGGANNQGLIRAFEEEVGDKVFIPENSRLTAAFGAALIAWDTMEKG